MAGVALPARSDSVDDGQVAVKADAGQEKDAAVAVQGEEGTGDLARNQAEHPLVGPLHCKQGQGEGQQEVRNGQVKEEGVSQGEGAGTTSLGVSVASDHTQYKHVAHKSQEEHQNVHDRGVPLCKTVAVLLKAWGGLSLARCKSDVTLGIRAVAKPLASYVWIWPWTIHHKTIFSGAIHRPQEERPGLCATFIPCILGCKVAQDNGDSCCVPFLPGALIALRTSIRSRYNIEGSVCDDWVVMACLPLYPRCSASSTLKEEGEVNNLQLIRDFELGRDIVDNIVSAVYSSRKTICVVSRNFLRSEWCSLELQLASYRLFDEHRDVLLLVFLEEISARQVSSYHRMRKVMLKKTYLQWPGSDCTNPTQAQELFWNQLRRAMRSGSRREAEEQYSDGSKEEETGTVENYFLLP
ncbi:Toll-like receptor 13 [Liparis tanakae]|uniref:Toll-like receptor 13 n=1 Tax=Liparis tanakae TaxID=230148 RepID=A0A4Z2JG61_9TELE|nr:Toll-like receptor 13 [Liparis tanakae]